MGITVNEALTQLKSYHNGFTGQASNLEESIDVAVDIMHKYQKIEAIVNWPVYIQEDVIRYKMICEVLGAPRP